MKTDTCNKRIRKQREREREINNIHLPIGNTRKTQNEDKRKIMVNRQRKKKHSTFIFKVTTKVNLGNSFSKVISMEEQRKQISMALDPFKCYKNYHVNFSSGLECGTSKVVTYYLQMLISKYTLIQQLLHLMATKSV